MGNSLLVPDSCAVPCGRSLCGRRGRGPQPQASAGSMLMDCTGDEGVVASCLQGAACPGVGWAVQLAAASCYVLLTASNASVRSRAVALVQHASHAVFRAVQRHWSRAAVASLL